LKAALFDATMIIILQIRQKFFTYTIPCSFTVHSLHFDQQPTLQN